MILVFKIAFSLDDGDLVIRVFLDLKNNFGIVDHQIILIYLLMISETICANS